MLLHVPDLSLKRIRSCYKRAERFACEGVIDPKHPLATAWANCRLFLDARNEGPLPKDEKKVWNHWERDTQARTFDIQCLDWFAAKVEDYSEKNLLEGDSTLAAILYEWRSRLGFDPTKLRIGNAR